MEENKMKDESKMKEETDSSDTLLRRVRVQ